jgi:hypothetical protein
MVDKLQYNEGEMVSGTIYLNVISQLPYNILELQLVEEEYVHWTEGSGKSKSTYRKKLKNYDYKMLIKQFDNNFLNQGHFAFPFEFLLPAHLPGSYFQSNWRYIKYSLSAILSSASKSISAQKG